MSYHTIRGSMLYKLDINCPPEPQILCGQTNVPDKTGEVSIFKEIACCATITLIKLKNRNKVRDK